MTPMGAKSPKKRPRRHNARLEAVQASEAAAPIPEERLTPAGVLRIYQGGSTETQPAKPLPPITRVRLLNTTRLLPARYSESVLTRIADTDEDLQRIYALDNATNERLLAEQNLRLGITIRELVFDVPHQLIINAAFTHPHPQGARFSTPFRGAWYAGADLSTAKAEVLFHRILQFAEINWNECEDLDYDQYLADFNGDFHDLRPAAFANAATDDPRSGAIPENFRACLDPRSYIQSQLLSIDLLAAGSVGLVYPSARRAGGSCLACFRPSLVGNVRKKDLFRLTWYPDKAPGFVRIQRAPPARTG